jgi:adenosylhomocysteine nucleosidase
MPHKDVAVVVAMRREVAPMLSGARAIHADDVEFYELENAVVAMAGMGRQAAGRAAEAVVARYTPGLLVSAGIAGALTPGLKVGHLIRARQVVDADSGAHFVTQGGVGTVVTVSSVSGSAEKHALAKRWSAAVVDMEASAVAAVAQRSGIGFAAIKSISDGLNFEMPPVSKFVNDAGKFNTLRFATFLATRPKWWGAVRQLSANSRIAAMNLSRELQHLIKLGFQLSPEEEVFGD